MVRGEVRLRHRGGRHARFSSRRAACTQSPTPPAATPSRRRTGPARCSPAARQRGRTLSRRIAWARCPPGPPPVDCPGTSHRLRGLPVSKAGRCRWGHGGGDVARPSLLIRSLQPAEDLPADHSRTHPGARAGAAEQRVWAAHALVAAPPDCTSHAEVARAFRRYLYRPESRPSDRLHPLARIEVNRCLTVDYREWGGGVSWLPREGVIGYSVFDVGREP